MFLLGLNSGERGDPLSTYDLESLQVTFGESRGDRSTAPGHPGGRSAMVVRPRSVANNADPCGTRHTAIDPNAGQNLWSVRVVRSSALARESHARQYASHISEAGDHARHRLVGMNLILQIHKALVLRRDEGFKHLPHWHDAVS